MSSARPPHDGRRRAERVSGVVLGNTWFWPANRPFRIFSRFMGTGLMQRKILEDNFFVERVMPISSARKLTELERAHYRGVQPVPAARRGVALMPKQIVDATPLLERLSRDVPAHLGAKPALIAWGMKDFAFRPGMIPRMRSAFRDVTVLELPDAKHYIQEDAPEEIAAAIARRFR
jgi:haloalkane dehalogenase